MLLNKFRKIYTQRRTNRIRNRLGLLTADEGGKRRANQDAEIILKSSALRRPKIKIYPSGNYGDALAN